MSKIKVGYTAGAFDIFHIGHLNLLQNAKLQVDWLIVGVSEDKLVEEYKNRSPIIPFEERIEIVRSIKYTDEVVAQTDLDKVNAWKRLRFDILFVGDDWKGNSKWIEYERKLEVFGVQVRYLPYTKGTSSTLIRGALINLKSK